VDENSSEVQDYIAKLTRVSEKTGVSFILIHHAGKGDPTCRDARELLRGSSGIFAALGSVFGLFGGATSEEPRLIKHLKSHPDAVGPTLDDFMLEIVDVPNGLNKFAGLHVGYRTIAEMEVKEDSYESVMEAVLACLKDGPESCGMSATDIQREVKKRKSLVLRAIDDFSRAGTAKNLGTDRAPRWVYNADAKEARR
jgi:hypothetical protein